MCVLRPGCLTVTSVVSPTVPHVPLFLIAAVTRASCDVDGQVALNTAFLWGHGVRQCAVSMSTAFAVTNDGLCYTWGGVNKWWQSTHDYDPVPTDVRSVRVHVHACSCTYALASIGVGACGVAGVQELGLQGVGSFSPSNALTDYSEGHESGLPQSPDMKWGKAGAGHWKKKAVAAVREERQLVREAEARRRGTSHLALASVPCHVVPCRVFWSCC